MLEGETPVHFGSEGCISPKTIAVPCKVESLDVDPPHSHCKRAHLRPVVGVFEYGLQHLVHGRNAGAASQHACIAPGPNPLETTHPGAELYRIPQASCDEDHTKPFCALPLGATHPASASVKSPFPCFPQSPDVLTCRLPPLVLTSNTPKPRTWDP